MLMIFSLPPPQSKQIYLERETFPIFLQRPINVVEYRNYD